MWVNLSSAKGGMCDAYEQAVCVRPAIACIMYVKARVMYVKACMR